MENFNLFTITTSSAVKAGDSMGCSVCRKSLSALSDLTGEWTNEQGGSPTHSSGLELDGFSFHLTSSGESSELISSS